MRINVLIPTIGRSCLLSRTLESVAAADKPPEFGRIIVLENGEEQNIGPSDVEGYRVPVRYKYVPVTGKAKTLQYALENIGQGFVIFLDDDVRVSKELLVGYAVNIRRYSHGHVYGGPSCPEYHNGGEPPEWLLPYLPYSAKGWDQSSDFPWFLGHNYGAFVSDILESGGFNASLGPGANSSSLQPVGEETELQQRLADRGCGRVYIPDAKVWHWVPEERSSVEWALRRVMRSGFTSGLQRREPSERGKLTPVPLWMFREVAWEAVQYCGAYCVGDPQKRFEMKKGLWRSIGVIRGVLSSGNVAKE